MNSEEADAVVRAIEAATLAILDALRELLAEVRELRRDVAGA